MYGGMYVVFSCSSTMLVYLNYCILIRKTVLQGCCCGGSDGGGADE